MSLDFSLLLEIWPDLLEGLYVTLFVIPFVGLFGFLLAVPLAAAEAYGKGWIKGVAIGYSVFFRGAPALVILYLVYNGLPSLGIIRNTFLWTFFKEPVFCAILALVLNHAGFLSEVLRGGLVAVPKGIFDAADSLALPRYVKFGKIYFPLAFRSAFSGYRNEFILMLKGTSLVGAVTVTDVLDVANAAVLRTYDPTTPLIGAAVIYLVLVIVTRKVFDFVEARLQRSIR